ncbi:unnamed protein product [Onchocerca ochengi]|uniref:Uncharacterized protein n=1 Tax=Onchocerca ochengi TaxID=42157 RepID=A0A182EPC6_ONCOC|nr:unnamed protein product [Onchocerca ochengi]VDM93693.1 unnamed protein product [Onchocerca ochengi]
MTTSRPPEIKTAEFKGNPKLWGLFITHFEEAIDKTENMTTTKKFAHIIGCLKGETLEHINDVAINEENYIHAMKNLKERYGDKEESWSYTILEKLDKSNRNMAALIRELLNIFSSHKANATNEISEEYSAPIDKDADTA